MKKHYFAKYMFILLCFFPLILNAEEISIIKDNNSVIYENASDKSNSLYTLNNNTVVSILDKTLYEGEGCDNKWYKVNYKDSTGYICSSNIRFEDISFENMNINAWSARINANNVTVRSGASTKTSSQDTLSLGVNVTVSDKIEEKNTGCSNNIWYKINYYGNKKGYICSTYVTLREEVTSLDAEYTKVLRDAGFPDSYIPYLTYLHNKYPDWKFVAKNTKAAFSTAVSNEEGKNYMQTKNNNYRTSSKPAEGSSWFKVNSNVIAFYMDPRNFLTEERIFMFEKLDYSNEFESIYPTLVKAIFGSGKLSDDKYTLPINNAGKTNKISPVHIASRIRLEVGANGSDSTNGTEFTFKGKKYSGYYNFFNIGAYEQTISGVKYSAITRGLAYAAKLIDSDGKRSKWDNIETAITEGSAFLANGYITKGQGTLYYQKFNVSPDAYYSKYTHQYMTNIQAPATEGNQTYNSYKKADILNQPFIFEIPVYKNMPDTTSLPTSGDTNNDLKSLQVINYSLTPSFDEDVLSYEVYVPSNETKVSLNAIAKSSSSIIDMPNEVNLDTNNTVVTVMVKAETGLEKKYVLTIKKVENASNVDTVLKMNNINIQNGYFSDIKYNSVISSLQSNLIKSGATNVIVKNEKGNLLNNNDYLSTGSSVTIQTINEEKTYMLVVNGDASGDGKITILDLLKIQKHIKGANRLNNAYLIAADTSGDGKVTILDLLQVQKHIKGAKKL